MGINLSKFEGPLGEYLNNLREKGQCEIVYPISDEIREKLKIKDKSKTFKSHEELDDFVSLIVKEEPEFQEKFSSDWLLLKSFDRAFWLRHFKHSEALQYMPKECPFKDPTQTTSFKKEWF